MQEEGRGQLWSQALDSELSGPLTHLGEFPFLTLGHLAVFASEVAAPKAQSVSTGIETQLLCNVVAKVPLGCVFKVLEHKIRGGPEGQAESLPTTFQSQLP